MDPQPNVATITSLAIREGSPHELFVSSDPDGVWYSDDALGGTLGFHFVPPLDLFEVHARQVVVAPTDPDRVSVMEVGGAFYYDSGTGTYSAATTHPGDQSRPWPALAVCPEDGCGSSTPADILLAGGLATGGLTSIRRSTDGGANWSNTTSGAPSAGTIVTDIEFNPVDGSHVWAATAPCDAEALCSASSEGRGLYFSSDGGQTWTQKLVAGGANGDPENAVNSVAVRNGDLLAATDDGLYSCPSCATCSSNCWTQRTTARATEVFWPPSSSTVVYLGTETGVRRSTNAGANWAATDFPSAEVSALRAASSDVDVVFAGYRYKPPDGICGTGTSTPEPPGVFFSDDGGSTVAPYTGIHGGYPMATLAFNTAGNDSIYAATVCQQGMFRLEDGDDWTQVGPGFPGVSQSGQHYEFHYMMRVLAHPSTPGVAFGTQDWNLWKTTDGGDSWCRIFVTPEVCDPGCPAEAQTCVASPPTYDCPVHLHGLAIAPSDPNIMYMGSGFGVWGGHGVHVDVTPRIYRSTDGGQTWPYEFEITDASLGGAAWDDDASTSLYDIAVSPLDPDVVYIATSGSENFPGATDPYLTGKLMHGQGVIRTTNGTAASPTWELVQSGLSTSPDCGHIGNCSTASNVNCSWWVNNIEMVVSGGQVHTYITTMDGLYKMVGDASSWTRITTPDDWLEALAFSPFDSDLMFIGTVEPGGSNAAIYRGDSTNGGTSWTFTGTTITMEPEAWALSSDDEECPNPAAPRYRVRDIVVGGDRAFAAVEGAGLYVTDGLFDCNTPRDPAEFSAAPNPVVAGSPVQFFAECAGCTHSWDFGEPCTSAAQDCDWGESCTSGTCRVSGIRNPQHSYTNPGLYTVSHQVGDGSTTCTNPLVKTDHIYVLPQTSDPDAYKPSIITGVGRGTTSSYPANVRAQLFDDTNDIVVPTATNFLAYSTPNYGVNVAAGRLEPLPAPCTPCPSAAIVTGAGPGPVHAPQVRGFGADNDPIAKINFYAYGTLRYGVRVGTADLGDRDYGGGGGADGADEILTGPGPGAVFGPHVRGWNYDGVALNACGKVSFFAYNTLKYGVNVAGEDLYSTSGDEIVTGPGPGAVFGPDVRQFNTQGTISKLDNFFAYGSPGDQYGVKVAAGAYDDGSAVVPAVVTARGPGGSSNYSSDVILWAWEDLIQSQEASATAFGSSEYGAEVAMGDVVSAGEDEIIVGEGPDPNELNHVVGFEYDGSTTLAPISGLDYYPYGPALKYGATVASVPADEPFTTNVPLTFSPTDAMLLDLRAQVDGVPDANYVCEHCCSDATDPNCDPDDPPSAGEWDLWGDGAQKELALAAIDDLHDTLPDVESAGAVLDELSAIEALLADPDDGIQDATVLAEVVATIDQIRAYYSPAAFAATGVTAVLDGFDEPSELAFSPAGNRVFVKPGESQAGAVQILDSRTLRRHDDREVPTEEGEVLRMHVPAGRVEAYVVTRRDNIGQPSTSDYAIERVVDSWSGGVTEYLDVLVGQSPSIEVTDLLTTSPGEEELLADTAWIAFKDGSSGLVKSIVGLDDLGSASVTTVGVSGRIYVALAPAPEGKERLYAAYSGGIDAIETQTSGQPTSQDVFAYPSGFGTPVDMTAGVTAGSEHATYIYAISATKMAVYDPKNESEPLVGTVDLDGDAVAVHLSIDGRFVLVTRHPIGDEEDEPVTNVTVVDANDLTVIRESATALCEEEPCDEPPPTPSTLTVDDDHGLVSEPGTGRLAYLYVTPGQGQFTFGRDIQARAGGQALAPDVPAPTPIGYVRGEWTWSLLATTVRAVKADAFTSPEARDALLVDAVEAAGYFLLAASASTEEQRRAILQDAAGILGSIQARLDGCYGGDGQDDVVTVCSEAEGMWNMARRLSESVDFAFVEPPELP